MDQLLSETLRFFLQRLASELNTEIDWRARGYGKNIFQRSGIYVAALVRDIIRIPLHDQAGIGQARFRARVQYIADDAIPTLEFFQANYPISRRQQALIGEARESLQRGVGLISDGRIPALDEWYATMKEFHELTEYSQQAARKIEEVLAESSLESKRESESKI
jgi:hypothetical protein